MKPAQNKVSFNLVLANDQRMKALNKKYRHLDKLSNVISFSLDKEMGGTLHLGEVVIDFDEALREAKRLRLSLRREILRLAIHGLRSLLNESRIYPSNSSLHSR